MKENIKNFCSTYLRLGYSFLLFLISLLAVFKAPTHFLWMLSVLATEYGHVFAIFVILVFYPGWRFSHLGRLSMVLGVLAFTLFLSPTFRAIFIEKELVTQFVHTFGVNGEVEKNNAFSFSNLIKGVDYPKIKSTSHSYGKTASGALMLDLYQPESVTKKHPCVIVIHGGSWQSGDNKQLPELNSYLAAKGYVVAAITYRLAPHWRFPAQIEDIQSAITFLKTRADEFELDASRIVLLGRSAGAHLALQAAYAKKDTTIRGVVSFYGPADLYYGYTHPANPLVLDSKEVISQFLGGTPSEIPDTYQTASPINYVSQFTPPTLLIHGGRDELVSPEQSRRLAARLQKNKIPFVLLEMPWATHGCDYNINGPGGQLSTYSVERFLAEVIFD